jgi:hypothetical protein
MVEDIHVIDLVAFSPQECPGARFVKYSAVCMWGIRMELSTVSPIHLFAQVYRGYKSPSTGYPISNRFLVERIEFKYQLNLFWKENLCCKIGHSRYRSQHFSKSSAK